VNTIQQLNPDELLAQDLECLLLIRQFENLVLELFQQGKLNGTTHTCLGQEYIPVALRTLFLENDYIFSNHRGHGHYLARFLDPEGLLAEIMGKSGAICNGVGGSQHIRRGTYLSSGIQGQSLPIAAGVALQLKRERKGAVAVVFIGDGTWGEGAVYEALNMAALWSLPLMVVVENNHIAQSTPCRLNLAGSIGERVKAFGIDHLRVESHDIATIRKLVWPALCRVRLDPAPLVVEFETQRLGPHSKGDDTRSAEETAELRKQDWLSFYKSEHPQLVDSIETNVKKKLQLVLKEVSQREPSRWETFADERKNC
jgi:acetoin:2,6-dichlorophenolindophenol oxidoreductase subunit alpha